MAVNVSGYRDSKNIVTTSFAFSNVSDLNWTTFIKHINDLPQSRDIMYDVYIPFTHFTILILKYWEYIFDNSWWIALAKNQWITNSLRPSQNGQHFSDYIFRCIFLYENLWTSIKISLKYICKGIIDNILALVQINAPNRLRIYASPGHLLVIVWEYLQMYSSHRVLNYYKNWLLIADCKYDVE